VSWSEKFGQKNLVTNPTHKREALVGNFVEGKLKEGKKRGWECAAGKKKDNKEINRQVKKKNKGLGGREIISLEEKRLQGGPKWEEGGLPREKKKKKKSGVRKRWGQYTGGKKILRGENRAGLICKEVCTGYINKERAASGGEGVKADERTKRSRRPIQREGQDCCTASLPSKLSQKRNFRKKSGVRKGGGNGVRKGRGTLGKKREHRAGGGGEKLNLWKRGRKILYKGRKSTRRTEYSDAEKDERERIIKDRGR